MKKKYEAQFPTNLMQTDEIEKNQFKIKWKKMTWVNLG
jgi:hypothetical protein